MAERTSRSGKKVVRVEAPTATEPTKAEKAEVAAEADRRVREGEGWKPTDAAKAGAKTKRIVAVILWAVAIALEAVGIWYLVTQVDEEIGSATWFLWAAIGLLVVLGILTVIGSQLWKAANKADPASRQEPVRFFVQNQLGAIIPILAFVPIIVLLLLNKNVDGRTKGIAGAVGAVVLIAAVLLGIEYAPNSQEAETEGQIAEEQSEAANEGQIDEYTAIVQQLTGGDDVWWTPQGNVYHLCEDVPELQLVSQDADNNVLGNGHVAAAHEAGKVGLTKEVTEELESCGFPIPANIDELEAEVDELRDNPED